MQRRGIILFISAFIMFSFQADQKLPEEVVIGIEMKVSQYRKKQILECKKKAIVKAIAIVDSIILARAYENRVDTITKPPRPERPEMPPVISTPDSTDVRPLFDQ